jgi:MATE family multidrug resistance protein
MNADLYVRSLCFIAIYIGFTVISARYGDVLLAVSSILMKLLMIFSYFTDGFAYAGEALTGRYIGAKDSLMVRQTVKWTFVWSMSIALIFMVIYQFAGVPMLHMMTSDAVVIEASRNYLPWLLLMPVAGCAAFTWDGIYIGATASRQMRNSMLWAVVAFVIAWAAGLLGLEWFIQKQTVAPQRYDGIAMHILMAAYFAHLLARTVYLTVKARKSVFSAI